MPALYNRQDDLKNEFNLTVQEILQLPEKDYHSRVSTSGKLRLKTLLRNINNDITLNLTLKLIDRLAHQFHFKAQQVAAIKDQANRIKPNSNGFDLVIEDPVSVVAEIKCNIPVKGGKRFGAKQIEGLKKDIDGLLHGKTKGGITPDMLHQYIRVLALYDTPEARQAAESQLGGLPSVTLDENLVADGGVHVLFLK